MTFLRFCLIFLFCICAQICFAQDIGFSENDVEIEADNFEYFKDDSKIVASGNVEVIQDQQKLYANQIIYYTKKDQVFAEGNVRFYDKNGYEFDAKNIELSDKFKKGIVNKFKLIFPDKSILMAESGERKNENISIIQKGYYTPCYFECGKTKPLWRVRADRITVNVNEQKVNYKNAFLEVKNIPVFYTPILTHPTPHADKKSGFLAPEIVDNTYLGRAIKIPYYYVISNNQDATLSLQPTSLRGTILFGEHRILTEYGRSETNFSLAKKVIKTSDSIQPYSTPNFRGYVRAFGMYNLPYDTKFSYDANLTSDKTYLKNYKPLSKEKNDLNTLTSTISVNRFYNKNMVIGKILSFQDLTDNTTDINNTPVALPYIKTKNQLVEFQNGSDLFLETNILSLHKANDLSYNRLSMSLGWKKIYYSDHGSVFSLQTDVRQDFYDYFNNNSQTNYNYFTGRTIPKANLEWSYPLINYYKNYDVILEPVANFIYTPKSNYNKKISNQDSLYIALDDANLFSANRYSGMDVVENNYRVDYGFKSSVYNNKASSINLMIGQSYSNFNENNPYNISNNKHESSNYFGRLSGVYANNTNFNYRFTLDKKKLTILNHEAEIGHRYAYLYGVVSYIADNDNVRKANGIMNIRELSVKLEFSKNSDWKIAIYGRKNLTNRMYNQQFSSRGSRFISAGAMLAKETECITSQISIDRDYTYMLGKKPSNTIMFRLALKNLSR